MQAHKNEEDQVVSLAKEVSMFFKFILQIKITKNCNKVPIFPPVIITFNTKRMWNIKNQHILGL